MRRVRSVLGVPQAGFLGVRRAQPVHLRQRQRQQSLQQGVHQRYEGCTVTSDKRLKESAMNRENIQDVVMCWLGQRD